MAGGDHLPAYCYFFSSAPTSPSRASCNCNPASSPPGGDEASTFDFTLGFSGQLQEATPTLAAADELFEGGRIRPLNAPHPSILRVANDASSGSADGTRCSPRRAGGADRQAEAAPLERGRSGCRPSSAAAAAPSSSRSRSRRATRSLSPFRGGSGLDAAAADDVDDESPPPSPRASSMIRGCGSGSGSRKWRLKDLFLFRSASEGRATGKDPLLKYTALSSASFWHPHGQPQRLSSASMSMRKGRGSAASAGDTPYATINRAAAAEDVRRRTTTATTTPLPFHRNSLFGYLRSNPAIHSISRKLGGSGHSGSSSSSSRGGRQAAGRHDDPYARTARRTAPHQESRRR
ncbi:Pheromone receptor [Zea mays]|nr:unknown [Zea mays]ONM59701.1 Pheromone receptor [Zea mays]